ncbi:MAG TPA: N-acetylmuramoyl-L-alanine amidase [Myxococcota bacterium]
MSAAAALLCVWLAPPRARAQDDHADRTHVRAVRHWSYDTYSRVVIELSGPVRASVQRLPADPSAERPERLYFDLPGVWVGRDWDAPQPVGDGLLAAIRLGQFESESARAVIDLARYERHRMFALTGPDRLVIDVFGPRAAAPPRSERDSAPALAGRTPPALPVPERKLLVVLDPGHGGEDPGTIAAHGMREKDITLAVARSAKHRLEARGFAVLLTRDRDRTVSLEERTAIAEGAAGDVFVSIHVNAAPRARVRGIETYYLDANHERHALGVAARESGVAPSQLDELQRVLAGFKVSEVGSRSGVLANSVHREVVGGVREAYGSVDDLGVKRGPFHVLFLSDAPAVLVEIGFLSNPTEAARLRSPLYRDVIAEQIARGLARFRAEQLPAVAGGPR